MTRRPRRCPSCGERRLVPIAYGYPGPQMWEAVDRGEIVLGGCIIEPDNPQWRCLSCSTDLPAKAKTRG